MSHSQKLRGPARQLIDMTMLLRLCIYSMILKPEIRLIPSVTISSGQIWTEGVISLKFVVD